MLLLGVGVLSAPVSAATSAECRAMFLAADADDDGVLTADELAQMDDVPDAFSDSESVTLNEFVEECSD
jgi:hypothetical protein